MLRLQSSILVHLVSSPSTYPSSSAQRLLYATASRIAQSPRFAVEQYLVDTCGLTRAKALKASTKLSHLKSPTNPDAVLAFLAGLDLSGTDIAALVAKDPLFLCTSVETTLAPIVVGLTGLGLSRTEIARLVSLTPNSVRRRSILSNLPYYLLLCGSYENILRVIKGNYCLLMCSLEKVVKPNVAFLGECRLDACHIAKLCIRHPRLLTANLERLQAMVACAEAVGVPRGSGMFRQALQAVAFLSEEKIAAKVEFLKKTFGWSDAEVGVAVCKFPVILKLSKDALQRKSDFLISEVGLEPTYIAHRSTILGHSLEGRLTSWYYVVKFLKENGLLDCDLSYNTTFKMSEKEFMEKFICTHKDAAPHLAEDYAAACRGQVPTRFSLGCVVKMCRCV